MGDRVLEEALALAGGAPDAVAVVECDPALADTAEFCANYGYALEDSANTIIVAAKTDPRRYVACVVLAHSRLDVNGVVRKRLGARKASFASAAETPKLSGMEIGGVTPFGLPPELELWIDRRVMERDQVIVGGGGRDRKLVVAPAVLAARAATSLVDDLARAG